MISKKFFLKRVTFVSPILHIRELKKLSNLHKVTQHVRNQDNILTQSIQRQSLRLSHWAQKDINLKAPGQVKGETAGVSQPTLTRSLSQGDWARGAETMAREGNCSETSLAVL